MPVKPKLRAAPALHVVPVASAPADEARDVDALYRRYAAYVAGVAVRLLGRDGEVDDLVQDVFVQALRGISQLREPAAIKGWLAKVTVRMAVQRLRRRRLMAALQLEAAANYELLAIPDTTPEQKLLLSRVYSTLDRMAARTRVIWTLRHVLGESLHSICELTGCSQSTVQRRLRDAEASIAAELDHA
jgi:RNA polymerase sigma-70 factor (ECF subfamily)